VQHDDLVAAVPQIVKSRQDQLRIEQQIRHENHQASASQQSSDFPQRRLGRRTTTSLE
jgi:hypothetical protein